MYYQIPNYSMKCRLYLSATERKLVDDILIGLRIAHNVTIYNMVKSKANTREATSKKDDSVVHFPDFAKCMKAEYLNSLKEQYPIIQKAPSGSLNNSVYGLFVDAKKAWETSGKKPVEFYKPQYYNTKKPRMSYSYREGYTKFIPSENNNVIFVNLAKVGKAKIRGWNKDIRFGKKHNMDFVAWIAANRKERVTITVEKDNCGDYYIIFKLSNVWKKVSARKRTQIGVDVGVKDIAITSNGDKYKNKHFSKQVESKREHICRKLSAGWGWHNEEFRKAHKKDTSIVPSKRYEKNLHELRRLERKVARRREHWNHQITWELATKHDFIGIENLDVKGMIQDSDMAFALADAAMSDVLTKLTYKSNWYGVVLVKIGRYEPSSQLCSCCGYKNEKVKNLNVRRWVCPECGTKHDRDINAAKNILKMALQKIA